MVVPDPCPPRIAGNGEHLDEVVAGLRLLVSISTDHGARSACAVVHYRGARASCEPRVTCRGEHPQHDSITNVDGHPRLPDTLAPAAHRVHPRLALRSENLRRDRHGRDVGSLGCCRRRCRCRCFGSLRCRCRGAGTHECQRREGAPEDRPPGPVSACSHRSDHLPFLGARVCKLYASGARWRDGVLGGDGGGAENAGEETTLYGTSPACSERPAGTNRDRSALLRASVRAPRPSCPALASRHRS